MGVVDAGFCDGEFGAENRPVLFGDLLFLFSCCHSGGVGRLVGEVWGELSGSGL